MDNVSQGEGIMRTGSPQFKAAGVAKPFASVSKIFSKKAAEEKAHLEGIQNTLAQGAVEIRKLKVTGKQNRLLEQTKGEQNRLNMDKTAEHTATLAKLGTEHKMTMADIDLQAGKAKVTFAKPAATRSRTKPAAKPSATEEPVKPVEQTPKPRAPRSSTPKPSTTAKPAAGAKPAAVKPAAARKPTTRK